MTLLATQRNFADWLRTGDDAAAERFGEAHAPGLRVYQNNYRAQLIACLEESFPHTHAWIGGEAFHAAMVSHIDRQPPSSWTLDAYPRDFPATLAAMYPDDPEVAELGWIECALGEIFVGPDGPSLDPARLDEIDWDRAILRFTPALDHHPLTTNAPAIWSALEAGEAPPAATRLPDAGGVIVWRDKQLSRFRTIDAAEREALLSARAGVPFAALCATLVDRLGEEDGINQSGLWLGQWVGDGLLSDILG